MFLFFDATRLLFLLHCSFLYIYNPNTHRDTHLISVRDFLYASQYRWRQHSHVYIFTHHMDLYNFTTIRKIQDIYKSWHIKTRLLKSDSIYGNT